MIKVHLQITQAVLQAALVLYSIIRCYKYLIIVTRQRLMYSLFAFQQ